jgi:exodeoxyribonuclease VII large subunit
MSIVRGEIENSLSSSYWVVAEISEIKVNGSGHCYLELIDKEDDSKQPRARVSAVIWANRYYLIASHFQTETGQSLQRGMKILVKCRVAFHEMYGLSLHIVDIDPIYTIGEAFRLRNQTIERLKADGVFDMNREKIAAEVLQRIAIVSSGQAAGFQDFINELNRCNYRFEVELFESVVQGDAAENSIINALDRINDRIDEFDCIAVIRGGGSQHDLSCFDSYGMCANLAQFPLPVLTGIGHDKDVSVADMVAYKAFKTPTAVATFLVEKAAMFEQLINSVESRINLRIAEIVKNELYKIDKISKEVKIVTQRLIAEQRNRLAVGQTKLSYAYSHINRERSTLSAIEKMFADRIKQFIETNRLKIGLLESLVKSHSPEQILKLGYSIVRVNGRVVQNVEMVKKDDNIEIMMYDGVVNAKVENVKSKDK